jgi:hypothetical protein
MKQLLRYTGNHWGGIQMIWLFKQFWIQFQSEKPGYEIVFNPKGINVKRIK